MDKDCMAVVFFQHMPIGLVISLIPYCLRCCDLKYITNANDIQSLFDGGDCSQYTMYRHTVLVGLSGITQCQ